MKALRDKVTKKISLEIIKKTIQFITYIALL